MLTNDKKIKDKYVSNYHIEPLYFQSEKEIIACDYYYPHHVDYPAVIVMAHGLAAERSFNLVKFAKQFAYAGYAVICFDYRGFGGSTGKPRGLVSIQQQLLDWKNVLQQVQKRKDIDVKRIVLWGFSLSGGHVLKLASELRFIQAIIAQTPYIDGQESFKLYPKKYLSKISALIAKDYMSKRLGLEAQNIPVIAQSEPSCYPNRNCWEGFLSLVPSHVEPVEDIPARIMFSLARYRPIQDVRKVTIPVFLLGATQDHWVPIEATRLCATNLAPFAQYHEFPIGHFDAFHGQWFDKNIRLQISFLHQHVGVES